LSIAETILTDLFKESVDPVHKTGMFLTKWWKWIMMQGMMTVFFFFFMTVMTASTVVDW